MICHLWTLFRSVPQSIIIIFNGTERNGTRITRTAVSFQYVRKNKFCGGFGGLVESPFDPIFHFHGKFWIHFKFFISLECHIDPKFSHTLFFILYSFNKSILLPAKCVQNCWVSGNSVDPDRTPHSVASYLGLHCPGLSEYVE